jgi:hypothetical protein
MAADFSAILRFFGVNAPQKLSTHCRHSGSCIWGKALRFLFYLLGFPMAGSHREQKTPAHTATVTAPDFHRIS